MKRALQFVLAATLLTITAQAQQPQPAYRFQPVFSSTSTVGGKPLPPNMTIDNVVFCDTGAFAVATHWNSDGINHSAILSPQGTLVATDDVIEGHIIQRLYSGALAMNDRGQVAFEASYASSPTAFPKFGIFVGRHLMWDIDLPRGNWDDFTLTEAGTILVNAKLLVTPAATEPQGGKPAPSNDPAVRMPDLPSGVQTQINKWKRFIPIPVPTAGQVIHPPDSGASSGNKPPQGSPVRPPIQPANAGVKCPVPAFPIPDDWQQGSITAPAPFSSFVVERPSPTRNYESPYSGKMKTPSRGIQFGADCEPQHIVITENSFQGRMEWWLSGGILTFVNDEGFLELPGFNQRAKYINLLHSLTPLRLNRSGHVLIPLNLADGFVVLLATPDAGAR